MKKTYEDDYELLYLISENSEEAKDDIFKKYEPVVNLYAKRYAHLVEGKGIDFNDLYLEGLIGINSALKNYKDQKDIKFSTFVFTCIKRKIITAVKNANRKKHSILNESYSIDYHNEDDDKNGFQNLIHDTSGGIEDLLVSKEDSRVFNKMINEELTEFEKQVYDLRINGFSHGEICKLLDKSPKSIEAVLYRIRVKLRNILDKIN